MDYLFQRKLGRNCQGEIVLGVVYIERGKAVANQVFYDSDGNLLELCSVPLGKFNSIDAAIEEVKAFSIEL